MGKLEFVTTKIHFHRLILTVVLAVGTLCSCERTQISKYVDWLYEAMPLPDSLSYPRSYWEANTAKTLEVRKAMKWGIPDREFRHFVLPLRVNNETLDDFRIVYADTLCARVKGMSISEAALEINHWCHEQATYQPSDARTSAPMATVRRGVGRCGEESVLAVAALRAAGIPARQVYTPRWAHTDDNHAWVEVWADGQWWFMGACEPEPALNMAWFNSPVSRAMLLHTKVYGDYHGDEDVIQRTPCYTEINVIRGYVPARRSVVKVEDREGNAVEGACVEFRIYNYGEFYPVARYLTAEDGRASLNTGCGDLLVWASKGEFFGFGKISAEASESEAQAVVTLEHRIGDEFEADIDIVPPVENPIVTDATPQQILLNSKRLAREDAIRAGHDHSNEAIKRFYKEGIKPALTLQAKDALLLRARTAKAIVDLLTDKDRGDVSYEVLADVLETTLSGAGTGEGDKAVAGMKVDPFILCPRVANEALLPHRKEILASGIAERIHKIDEIIAWTRDSIRVVEGKNPQGLAIPPQSVWRSRLSDARSRGIFFVALSRTLGYAARIDEVTGKVQYREYGKWRDVNFDNCTTEGNSSKTENRAGDRKAEAKSLLTLEYKGGLIKTPMYYRHFTLSDVASAHPHLLEFGSDADQTSYSIFKNTELDCGYYMLTSGARMADGSVLAHLSFFNLGDTESKRRMQLVIRQAQGKVSVIGSMDPEKPFTMEGATSQQSLLSATGRGYFLLAIMGEGDEPSVHARMELQSVAKELNHWKRPAVILNKKNTGDKAAAKGIEACEHIKGINYIFYGTDPGAEIYKMLCEGCEKKGARLPVIAICDSFGRIVYFSQGYNTSLGADIARTIAQL